jgi:hypothetical protein
MYPWASQGKLYLKSFLSGIKTNKLEMVDMKIKLAHFPLPGFSQIQFEGFCRFINQGLAEELEKLSQF